MAGDKKAKSKAQEQMNLDGMTEPDDAAGPIEDAETTAPESATDDGSLAADEAATDGDGVLEAEPVEEPVDEGKLAVELVSTHDGCWMITRDGEKHDLSDEDWRKELAHAVSRNTPIQA